MTIQRTATPARAARRQLLRDRIAEYLTDHGAADDHATAYATDLLAIIDELGFTLPAAIDDVPSPTVRHANPDHQAACMAEIRAALAAKRRGTPVDEPTLTLDLGGAR